ncbi:hypothetical protein [Sphaerimonospora mesophila]|uniref:hypothetical protein n=1 Tax=Sphaerimonospora mesophila TaxID=37483 RepID=UPI0006E2559D
MYVWVTQSGEFHQGGGIDSVYATKRAARAGLPPYTEEEWTRERERTLTAFLANPPEPLPLAEAVRRHWRPGRAAWERWHAENPGVCDCQPGRPSQFCLPDVPG